MHAIRDRDRSTGERSQLRTRNDATFSYRGRSVARHYYNRPPSWRELDNAIDLRNVSSIGKEIDAAVSYEHHLRNDCNSEPLFLGATIDPLRVDVTLLDFIIIITFISIIIAVVVLLLIKR